MFNLLAGIHQGGLRSRVNQQIDVAAPRVFAATYLSEHAHVRRTMCSDDTSNFIALRAKRSRGAHESEFLARICSGGL